MSAAVLQLSMARIAQNATPVAAPEPSHSTLSHSTLSHSTLRLTRRGRIVITTLAAIPLVVGALVLAMSGGMALAAEPATPASYITMQPGQSLWDVAERVAPLEDPRDVIVDIAALNCLTGDAVQPGQRLALPTNYSY